MGLYHGAARGVSFLGGLLDVDNGSDEELPPPPPPSSHPSAAASPLTVLSPPLPTGNVTNKAAKKKAARQRRNKNKKKAQVERMNDENGGTMKRGSSLDDADVNGDNDANGHDHANGNNQTIGSNGINGTFGSNGSEPVGANGTAAGDKANGGQQPPPVDAMMISTASAASSGKESAESSIAGQHPLSSSSSPSSFVNGKSSVSSLSRARGGGGQQLRFGTREDMALLESVGMGRVADEGKSWNASADAMQRTFLAVCRRGYASRAQTVKDVIDAMWHLGEPYDDADTVELQLKNSYEVDGRRTTVASSPSSGARRCRDEDAAHVHGAGGSGGGHALSHNGHIPGESVANGGDDVAAADIGGEGVDVSDGDDDDAREAIDPAQRVKDALVTVATCPSSEAALSALAQWAALHHRRFRLVVPTPSSGGEASPPGEAFPEKDNGIGLSPLFDSAALPILFRRIFMMPPPPPPPPPPTSAEDESCMYPAVDEFEVAKRHLEELLRWALPNLSGDAVAGHNASATAVLKHCSALLIAARRIRSHGDGAALLSPEAAELMAQKLAGALRGHRNAAFRLEESAAAAVGLVDQATAAAETVARVDYECNNARRAAGGAEEKGGGGPLPMRELFKQRESRREAAAALGRLCRLTASATGVSLTGGAETASGGEHAQDVDVLRALWSGHPCGGAVDVSELGQKRAEIQAGHARLAGLRECADREIAPMEAAAAECGARLEGLMETREMLIRQLLEVDLQIGAEQQRRDQLLESAASTRANYEAQRAAEAEDLKQWESAMRHAGECERVPAILSSLRRELQSQLHIAARRSFAETLAGRLPGTVGKPRFGSAPGGPLGAYVDALRAYLETEEQCLRRLSERAASEEAELSSITCEIAQYDGLYMPSLTEDLQAKKDKLITNIREDRAAEYGLVEQARREAITLAEALSCGSSSVFTSAAATAAINNDSTGFRNEGTAGSRTNNIGNGDGMTGEGSAGVRGGGGGDHYSSVHAAVPASTFAATTSVPAAGTAGNGAPGRKGGPPGSVSGDSTVNGYGGSVLGAVDDKRLSRVWQLFSYIGLGESGERIPPAIPPLVTTGSSAGNAATAAAPAAVSKGGGGGGTVSFSDFAINAIGQGSPSAPASLSAPTGQMARGQSGKESSAQASAVAEQRSFAQAVAPTRFSLFFGQSPPGSATSPVTRSAPDESSRPISGGAKQPVHRSRARNPPPSRIRGGVRLPSPPRDGGRSLGGHLNWLNNNDTTNNSRTSAGPSAPTPTRPTPPPMTSPAISRTVPRTIPRGLPRAVPSTARQTARLTALAPSTTVPKRSYSAPLVIMATSGSKTFLPTVKKQVSNKGTTSALVGMPTTAMAAAKSLQVARDAGVVAHRCTIDEAPTASGSDASPLPQRVSRKNKNTSVTATSRKQVGGSGGGGGGEVPVAGRGCGNTAVPREGGSRSVGANENVGGRKKAVAAPEKGIVERSSKKTASDSNSGQGSEAATPSSPLPSAEASGESEATATSAAIEKGNAGVSGGSSKGGSSAKSASEKVEKKLRKKQAAAAAAEARKDTIVAPTAASGKAKSSKGKPYPGFQGTETGVSNAVGKQDTLPPIIAPPPAPSPEKLTAVVTVAPPATVAGMGDTIASPSWMPSAVGQEENSPESVAKDGNSNSQMSANAEQEPQSAVKEADSVSSLGSVRASLSNEGEHASVAETVVPSTDGGRGTDESAEEITTDVVADSSPATVFECRQDDGNSGSGGIVAMTSVATPASVGPLEEGSPLPRSTDSAADNNNMGARFARGEHEEREKSVAPVVRSTEKSQEDAGKAGLDDGEEVSAFNSIKDERLAVSPKDGDDNGVGRHEQISVEAEPTAIATGAATTPTSRSPVVSVEMAAHKFATRDADKDVAEIATTNLADADQKIRCVKRDEKLDLSERKPKQPRPSHGAGTACYVVESCDSDDETPAIGQGGCHEPECGAIDDDDGSGGRNGAGSGERGSRVLGSGEEGFAAGCHGMSTKSEEEASPPERNTQDGGGACKEMEVDKGEPVVEFGTYQTDMFQNKAGSVPIASCTGSDPTSPPLQHS